MAVDRISHYVLGEVLGRGSYAHVRAGKDLRTGRDVAVKVVDRNALNSRERARLTNEANITAALHHPHIVRLLDLVEDGSTLHFVLQRAHGWNSEHFATDMLTFVNTYGRVTEREACRLFLQLLSALDHAHRLGFIHRDIKLENLFLDGRNVLVGDWGFSTRWSASELLTESLGSARYASPEIMSQQAYVGPEVDVWSAGVVLFALACGRLPFRGDGRELKHNILTANYQCPAELSAELKQLFAEIFVLQRERRASVHHLLTSAWVKKFLDEKHAEPRPAVVPVLRHHSLPDLVLTSDNDSDMVSSTNAAAAGEPTLRHRQLRSAAAAAAAVGKAQRPILPLLAVLKRRRTENAANANANNNAGPTPMAIELPAQA